MKRDCLCVPASCSTPHSKASQAPSSVPHTLTCAPTSFPLTLTCKCQLAHSSNQQLPAHKPLNQALAHHPTYDPTMADTEATLSKVDSATQQPEVKAKRRPSSMAADCYDILDLRK